VTEDLNDQQKSGKLPADPAEGAVPMSLEVPRVHTVKDITREALQRALSQKKQDNCMTGHWDMDRITGGFRPGFVWVFGADTSWGKCLGRDVRVLRADGATCAAHEVRDGDLLMGPDSEPRTVRATTAGRGPMYRVVPMRGDSWECNWAHVLTLVSSRTGKIIDISVEDFLKKTATFRHQHRLFHVGVEYPDHDLVPVDPWFVGVWYGDGTKDLITVSVTTEDHEISDGLAAVAANWGLHLRCNRKPGNSAAAYALAGTRSQAGSSGNPLIRVMRQIYGDGLALPRAYTHGTRKTRLEFLAGLIDSDGFKHGDRVCEVLTKNEEWATGLRLLCRSLGLQAKIYRKTGVPGYEDRVYWRVQISGDLSVVPTRIARKRFPPSPDARRSCLRVGFTIEPIGDGEFCGWELDRDGRFLLADYTVTHNSSWIIMIADENIRAGKRVLIVSSEDDKSIYGDRLLLRRSRVSADNFKARTFTLQERAALDKVVDDAEDKPVYFDARGRSVEWVASRTKLLIKEHAIDLVAFDYLQAFDSDKRHQDRRNQVSYIARALTDVTKTLGVAGIICSQLTMQEGKAHPDKHSIRESRDVANAAEVVALGFTPDKPIKRNTDGVQLAAPGDRCVFLDKVKDGARGALLRMSWDDNSACFNRYVQNPANRIFTADNDDPEVSEDGYRYGEHVRGPG